MVSRDLRDLESRLRDAERIEDWMRLAGDALDIAERQHALLVVLCSELDAGRWQTASDALHRYLSGHG